jgi:pimeloyl-ACP methyl ester carboxylesterase/putative sterol carrier protein
MSAHPDRTPDPGPSEHPEPGEVRELGTFLLERIAAPAELGPYRDATVSLDLESGGGWTLVVRNGALSIRPGRTDGADTTIVASIGTMKALASGERSGVEAYLDGSLRVRGNLELSLRLSSVFRSERTPIHYPQPRDVHAGGLRAFAMEAGSGTPVVLLHGLGATNSSMLPTMWELADDHRVVAPDFPGFGGSDKPLRPLHAAYYAGWLVDFLDEMGIERAHLVGNSMGGRVAIETGLRHPDRVDRIVLFAPSPAFLREREYLWIVKVLRPELSLIPLPFPLIPRSRVVDTIRAMFHDASRIPGGWLDAAADEFMRQMESARGRRAFFSAARQIYLEDPYEGRGGFWRRLPELEPPALFIWGRQDRLVPVGFAPHIEQALPSATSIVLDDCGHVPQYERPEETHALVRSFLEPQDAADAGDAAESFAARTPGVDPHDTEGEHGPEPRAPEHLGTDGREGGP